MTSITTADCIFFLCKNCIPGGKSLPAQWTEAGMHVRIKEIPCSGKIDAQYILHAFEGGVKAVGVIACPQGDCTLSQGNYRAEMRVRTVQRLLAEIGLDPERIELLRCSSDE
jgi:coenzyme F420-reducing hydrogenase delta subunit